MMGRPFGSSTKTNLKPTKGPHKTKLCRKCGRIKLIEEFRYIKRLEKFNYQCKECANEMQRNYFDSNPSQKEKNRARARNWQHANRHKKEYKWKWGDHSESQKKIILQRAKDKRKVNPDKYRDQWLRLKYGIGLKEFDAILERQNGKCSICKRIAADFKPSSFHVDHDHKTGRIRGILCVNCNQMLGQASDDITRFYAAIEYLKQQVS